MLCGVGVWVWVCVCGGGGGVGDGGRDLVSYLLHAAVPSQRIRPVHRGFLPEVSAQSR